MTKPRASKLRLHSPFSHILCAIVFALVVAWAVRTCNRESSEPRVQVPRINFEQLDQTGARLIAVRIDEVALLTLAIHRGKLAAPVNGRVAKVHKQ